MLGTCALCDRRRRAGRGWLARLAAGATAVAVLGLLPACGLRHGSTAQSSAASDAVGQAVAQLLQQAAKEDDDADQHDSRVAAVAALGPPAVPHLAKALGNPDEDIRSAAVEALGKMRGAAVVDALLLALNDKKEEVRLSAVQALGAMGDRRAVQPLLDQFAKDDNPQVRYECLTSLGLIGAPGAVDLLVKETSDSDPNVRLWAIDALCQMHDPHAGTLAVALLQDPNVYVRLHAIQYCGNALNTPEGRTALIRLAIDAGDFETTVWARRHLMNYVEQGADGPQLREQMRAAGLEELRGKYAVRAAMVLGDLGDHAATDELIRALRDPEWVVRHHAAYLLARVGELRAVPPLIATLHDPVPIVRATAYNSLLWFADDGDPRAQKVVRTYAGSKFDERLPR